MMGHHVVFIKKGQTEFREMTVAQPAEHEVLVQILYSVISAGTERANLLSMPNTLGRFPMVPGYSAVGRVIQTGENVSGLSAGDRVLVYHGGHQSHSIMREDQLFKVKDERIDSCDAAFTVIASMSLQGLRKIRPELGTSIMVIGLGLLGLFAVQLARLSGGVPVAAVDYNETRLKLAYELGTDAGLSPDEPKINEHVQSITKGKGFDAIIEVTGSSDALKQALQWVAWQGRISLLGCTRISKEPIDFYQWVHKRGVSLIGAHNFVRPKCDSYPGYWTREDDYRVLLDLMRYRKLNVKSIISEIVSPTQAPKVYQRLADDPQAPLGVVFDWQQL
jgi:2-desacetyl-2-hydroxyethyl bacteriochlorophyllide A dehydrogenase